MASSSAAVSSSGGCNGCLEDQVFYGNYTAAEISAVVDPGVTIENGYGVYLLTYHSDGRLARATVTVPYGVTAPQGGWHIAVNNPGTVGMDDACALGGTVAAAGLAGLYGARGLVGVAVDYPGLGTPGLHPYLVARVEGAASLDGVRATQTLLSDLAQPTSGKVVITGLSQGGHATLSAAAMHGTYAPELVVKGFGAAAPATVWLEHWSQGVALMGGHQAYHLMTVLSFQVTYGRPGTALEALFAPGVASNVTQWAQTLCVFTGTPTLPQQVGNDPALIFQPAFLAAYAAADLSAYPDIAQGFAASRVTPYTQTAPLRIWQGLADTTVPAVATAEVVATLQNAGMDVTYTEVPGADHADVAFGFLAYPQLRTEEALAWVREQLARP